MQSFLTKLPLIVMVGLAVIVIIVVLVLTGILPGRSPSEEASVGLEFWSIEDPAQHWTEILSEYKKLHKNVSIKYRLIDESRYEEELVNNLARGTGPDIFILKNLWVKKHADKISPLPQSSLGFSTVNFTSQFADIAAQDLISSTGQILGLPLFIDTPALLYNKDEFNRENIAIPPRTWSDLTAVAQRFTKKNTAGDILKSGVALGTANNTNRSFEILISLFFQFGDPIVSKTTESVALRQDAPKALALYTSFADPVHKNFSWSERMSDSLQALAEENAVMAIGLSRDVSRVRKENSHLNLGVAAFPQQAESGKKILYGTYFFPTVSAQSPNAQAAWQFLLYVASGDGARSYEEKTLRPPARRDLIAAGPFSVAMDPYWRQTLIAQSFLAPDEEKTKNIFSEAISAVTSKALTPSQAMQELATRLGALLIKK